MRGTTITGFNTVTKYTYGSYFVFMPNCENLDFLPLALSRVSSQGNLPLSHMCLNNVVRCAHAGKLCPQRWCPCQEPSTPRHMNGKTVFVVAHPWLLVQTNIRRSFDHAMGLLVVR
jgi:hypothetical protein